MLGLPRQPAASQSRPSRGRRPGWPGLPVPIARRRGAGASSAPARPATARPRASAEQLRRDPSLDGRAVCPRGGFKLDEELPARRAAWCAASIHVAVFSVSTSDCQSRDSPAAAQEVGQHVQGRCIAMTARHGAPAEKTARCRIRLEEREVAPARLVAARLSSAGVPSAAPEGTPAKWPEIRSNASSGLDVADDDQYRSVWPVVGLVKRLQVRSVDASDVVGPAQDRVAIRMPKVGDRQVGLLEPALRRIELAGPAPRRSPAARSRLRAARTGPRTSGRPRSPAPAPSGPTEA